MKNIKDIRQLTRELGKLYPMQDMYGSRATVYSQALNDDLITKDQYDSARKHYGALWQFVGD